MSHAQQRLHCQMKKRKELELLNKTPSLKVLEEQRRQEGLEKAIDSSNKGFSLLQKMGYKPGSGIGKNSKRLHSKTFYYKQTIHDTFMQYCSGDIARLRNPKFFLSLHYTLNNW